jgi:Uma2 family endonuclease
MSTLPKPRLTPEEYLEIEDAAEYKSEYYQGEMFAMAGATYNHNLIALNAAAELRQQLKRRPCTVCSSDMRIHTPRTGLYTYADAVVICGEPAFLGQNQMTLLNPTVIIEVLSPTTEAYDRGRKFEHYQSIDSLREYLLIASDRMSATLYRRQSEQQWLITIANTPESAIELESAGCRLPLLDLYDKVDFPADERLAAAQQS